MKKQNKKRNKGVLQLIKNINNKGFWLVFIPFILFTIADLATTLMNSDLIPLVELNPVYTIFKSIIPIIILNILVVPAAWFFYTYISTTPATRYLIIQMMMMTIAIRIVAIRNALQWYYAPVEQKSIEVLQQKYTPEVMHAAQVQYILLVYVPLLFCILTFLLWYWDHNVTRKDQKKNIKK